MKDLFELRENVISEINNRMKKFLLAIESAGEPIISIPEDIFSDRHQNANEVSHGGMDFQLIKGNTIVDYGNYRIYSNELGEYTQEYPTYPLSLVENYTPKSLADYVADKKLKAMKATFRRDEEELEDGERFDGQE
jgi:hypothetical protein